MAPTQTTVRRPLCAADVFALAATDTAVARHLAAWTSGSFASWEDMLISLVCTMAARERDHSERLDHYLLTLGR